MFIFTNVKLFSLLTKYSKTYRFLTLSLAFMMFFSSFGFSMDIHFCKGKIEKVQLFGSAECDMDMKMEPIVEITENECCHKPKVEITKSCHNEENAEKSKCCYNETIVIDVTNDVSEMEASDVSFEHFSFFTYFILSSYVLFFPEETNENFKEYSPPLISKDISVLHQVFII